MKHPDILGTIGDRYFLVEGYEYIPESYDLLNAFFKEAFQKSGLEGDIEYFKYNRALFVTASRTGVFRSKPWTAEEVLAALPRLLPEPEAPRPPLEDSKLLERFEAKFPPPPPPTLSRTNALGIPISRNEFRKALGTLRRLETRRNRGENVNQRALENASRTVSFYEAQNPNQTGGRRHCRARRKTRKV